MPALRDSIEDILLLSPMQEAMFLHQLSHPESPAYYVQVACRIDGEFDLNLFRRAWEIVADRHASLKTAFAGEKRDRPVQVIYRSVAPAWDFEDWSDLPLTEQERRLEERVKSYSGERFALTRPPLYRLTALRLGDEAHWLILRYHHSIMDGWSLPVVWTEVESCYGALRAGRAITLAPPAGFPVFIDWLRRQPADIAREFWTRRFAGFSGPSLMRVARPDAGAVGRASIARREITLDAELSDGIRRLAKECGITASAVLHAAWGLLVSRYSGLSDNVIGSVVSCRPPDLAGSDRIVGNLINTVPVWLPVTDADPVSTWLKQAARALADAHHHAYASLTDMRAWSGVDPAAPLFESVVVVENYPLRNVLAGGTELRVGSVVVSESTNLPLTVVIETGARFQVRICFDDAQYEARIVQMMLDGLETILSRFESGPAAPVWRAAAPGRQERLRISTLGQGQPCRTGSLAAHEAVENRVRQSPDAAAVISGEAVISYAELDRRASAIAQSLASMRVGPDVRVAIYMPRSPELVAAILGVWKAGGAWSPLDPSHPVERVRTIVEDLNPAVILTNGQSTLPVWDIPTLSVASSGAPTSIPEPRVGGSVQPDNLAYILYTSGSTGRPKGVMITHRGLSNYLAWAIDAYRADEGSPAPVHSPIGFDLTLTSLLPSLIAGRGIRLLPATAGLDTLCDLLRNQPHCGILKITPAHLELLNDALPDACVARAARTIVIGGEALHGKAVARWRKNAPAARIVNEYGPTETVVGCCVYEAGVEVPDSPVPIGRPIAGARLYVLNAAMEPAPIGVEGELYIGGVGVARGYLGRASLTAERFVPDPFEAGGRLYRTGDLARLRADGVFEYLGRADEQIKCSGYRIEPGEIEAVVCGHPAVRECVVGAVGKDGEPRRLVAWWSPRANQDIASTSADLRNYVLERLPAYMAPATFVSVPSITLTENGKVDRRALPQPGESAARAGGVKARTVLERSIAEIWAQVLGLASVGVDQNFFELGGNSLLLLRTAARMRSAGICDLSAVELFRYPTVESVAAHLAKGGAIPKREPEAVPNPAHLPSEPSRLEQRRRAVQAQ